MDSLALKIAGNFLTDASIQDSFAQAGLHLKVSLAEKKITYYAKDLISDLESAMGSSSDQTMEEMKAIAFLIFIEDIADPGVGREM